MHSRFAAERILDGGRTNTESRWASAKTPEPHWIKVKFPSVLTFDRVVAVGHEGDLALAEAEVQTRRDGEWVTVGEMRGDGRATIEGELSLMTATAVRLYVTKACRRDNCARLFEIELWRGDTKLPLVARGVSPPPAPVDASKLVASVVPLRLPVSRNQNARTLDLMRRYYESVMAWDDILLARMEPVPGKPECGYYGEGRNVENDIRSICYAALVNAFLVEAEVPAGVSAPSDQRRARMRADAIRALRYLRQGHKTGEGACVNGKQWGNAWQSAMWTRSFGLAGWLLWERLDAELREGVARVVEFEADRFLRLKPKSSEFRDTGAEENAWNAQILSLACNMMPGHPRAAKWADAAKLWMYNALSVKADAAADTLGDDSKPIRGWVTTVNAHPDFTVENHGLIHVGYLKTSIALNLENAIPYLLTGRQVPKACLHHASDCFAILCKCMDWEGAPIYFSGNDWKLIHTQNVDILVYALLSVLADDARAAHLEDVALPTLRRIQAAESGYYNVRRDLEYGGVCATRLIACYLAHAAFGEGAQPMSEQAISGSITGVTLLEHAKAILHRTPTKFASFSWGAKRMALAMPRNGSWTVWPHFASYVGRINGKNASERSAKLTSIRPEVGDNAFSVTARLERFDGAVTQDLFYASLPDDVTVYIERLTTKPGFEITSRETGIIGLDYELGSNQRTLYTTAGQTTAVGVGGTAPRIVEIESDWLNLGNRVGYVVKRVPDVANVIRYHDEVEGTGRVPKLQEWVSLVGERGPSAGQPDEQWACVVTFLNQISGETKAMVPRVEFAVDGDSAVCRVGESESRALFPSPRE